MISILDIIIEELKEYGIKEIMCIPTLEFTKLIDYNLIEKYKLFEKEKNYLIIMKHCSIDVVIGICWLGKYNYDVYYKKLFNHTSFLICNLREPILFICEIENSFDLNRFCQILEHIFSNYDDFKSKGVILNVNNETIGEIFVRYIYPPHCAKNTETKIDNSKYYSDKIEPDINGNIDYDFKI